MAAQALYRKWRPQTFEEVVGQQHVIHTLQNALQGGHISHAYLFAGPRGTGKTSVARLLAKAVNCLSEGDAKPCNQCRICRAINQGRLLDLIEIDAASNRGIDEIRNLRDKIGFRPNEARYKVYILDEAHMLTEPAFNALLKTLEEPPPHVIFVLVTTEPHKIPATILSRCQRFDFRPIALDDIVARLEHIADREGLSVEPAALQLIARQATGSMRDAESLLDQLMAYGGGKITLAQVQAILGAVPAQAVGELVDRLVARDLAGGLEAIGRAIGEGVDPRQLARQVVEHLRGLLLIKVGGSAPADVSAEEVQKMKGQAAQLSVGQLLRAVKLFNQAQLDLRGNLQPQLPLELAFVEATLGEQAAAPPKKSAPQAAPVRTKKVSEPKAPIGAGEKATLEGVRINWARILAQVKVHNRSVEALLKSCEPVAVEGEVVVLGFYYPFHKEKIEEPSRKALVERVISQVVGSPCRVKCVLSPKGGRRTRATRKPAEEPKAAKAETEEARDKYQAVVEDPLIKAAVSKYGARVVDVK
ncbi:MAG TPA: DNA polymerase III subunit gamma/tau [Anaerolineae bacterium]|nr:DNA polymerase III subunit gamma/tau [Anaerolineae bacterium]